MSFQNLKKDLIFDIGAHTGEDTEFYLEKGFKVIAVEANPEMCIKLEQRFSRYLREQKLFIIQKAIVQTNNSEVSIYVNDSSDGWSSIYEEIASKGVHQVRKIKVDTVTLHDLCAKFGTPYFMKVDIELADILVANSLRALNEKPKFCSFEMHSPEIIHVLNEAGYSKFQIRNQFLNGLLVEPKSTKEGKNFWPQYMDGYHSGPFGLDLPEKDWVTFQEIIRLYEAYLEVKRYSQLGDSWFDVHATSF